MAQERYALMLMDMQNDFCRPEGVFPRHGLDPSAISPIIPRIRRVMGSCRRRRIPIIASQFTVLTDPQGQAMGLGHVRALHPFLEREGFRDGSWGQQVIDDLPRPHYTFRKWGYSAMYLTELEKLLRSLSVTTLVFTGIATYGAVEGTARDAVARELEVITLSDCVTGYNLALHEASLKNLANLGRVMASEEFVRSLQKVSRRSQ